LNGRGLAKKSEPYGKKRLDKTRSDLRRKRMPTVDLGKLK
jgi:hypothetical protein